MKWFQELLKKLGRKYLTAVLAALLVLLNRIYDLGLDAETMDDFVLIIGMWIGTEGVIDAASAFGEKMKKAP